MRHLRLLTLANGIVTRGGKVVRLKGPKATPAEVVELASEILEMRSALIHVRYLAEQLAGVTSEHVAEIAPARLSKIEMPEGDYK
jgi:hypothetical protein